MLEKIGMFFSGVKGRFLRSVLATGAGVALATYKDNVWLVSLGPFLQTLGKYLREKNVEKWGWLPF